MKRSDNEADQVNYNCLYSSAFVKYLLNNWCGLIPLWTSLHLGDQGRHGTSEVYINWSNIFRTYDCVVNPPKTQGIVELHQKSAKHISLNSKRERIDNVISSLCIHKKSKLRQYEIAKSRMKETAVDSDKIKDTLPFKISKEKWRKKKQYKGPGYFQKNLTKKANHKKEEWEKVPIIPWGGNYIHSDDLFSDNQEISLYNTCTIDNFFQIILMFYSLNINQMQRLYDSTDPLVRRISEILQLLLMNNFDVAKYNWLTKVCQLLPNSMNVLDVFGTDKNMVMEPIKEVFRRGYEFSTCSSEMCPLNTIEVKEDHVCDMTLHSPDKIENDTQLIKSSIKEWELGSSSKAVISCKGRFDDEPDHGDFFAEDINGKSIIRCSGWRTPLNMKFDTKPPFLIFDISAVFRDDLKNLSCIPYDIFVYDDHYR